MVMISMWMAIAMEMGYAEPSTCKIMTIGAVIFRMEMISLREAE